MNAKAILTSAAVTVCACLAQGSEKYYDWVSSGTYKVGATATFAISSDGEDVYVKLSGLKAGNSYTFVANGSGAAVEVVYTYKDDGDLWDGTLAQSEPDLKTDDQERCIVYYDDWVTADIVRNEDYDNSDWKEYKVSPSGYYLCVSGDAGAKITVTSSAGAVEEKIPEGDEDNPKAIVPASLPATYSSKFVNGDYYFTIKSAKVGKYLFTTSLGTAESPITLTYDSGTAEFTTNDVSAAVTTEGNVAHLVTVTEAGTLNFYLSGKGTSFALTHQFADSGTLGKLTVDTKGADGTWSIKGAKDTYPAGTTIGILGKQTIVFSKVTGFSTPTNMIAMSTDEVPMVSLLGVYNDTFDPKDNAVSGATKLTISAKTGKAPRTLFVGDAADHFSFSAKAGVYYNFALADLLGDAEMTVFAKSAPEAILAGPATNIAKQAFASGDYIVKVARPSENDAQYTLAYSSANVGAISFAKTAVSVKKSTGSVALTVNRSASEGKVRVFYQTFCDSAKPGVDYVAQSGELVWENGDKKAKTITIRLIPEAVATGAISRQFTVRLTTVDAVDLEDDEYLASIASGKGVATVTVTEAKAKAAAAVKVATTKTESVPLETGTYQGVIAEDGSSLLSGFAELASVTFTAKNAVKKALSAKVILGGKTYSFSADTWNEESDDVTAVAVMSQNQKIGSVTYTNELRIELPRGATDTSGDWANADASVELKMNIADSDGEVREDVSYAGTLYRDNSKIQDYLTAVTNAVGYYTVALSPSGVTSAMGIPAGNGYLTMTIDNKGKAKIAGLLADGSTKPSYTSIISVRDDGGKLFVPVFIAKSPYCFGGTLVLKRAEDGRYVVDSTVSLIWNNDNALLTYDGDEGWRMSLDPVGGYFNTTDNLQAHYLTSALSVSTVDASDLLSEACASGYSYADDAVLDDLPVSLVSNTLSTQKKSVVKNGKLVNLTNSVNVCNVQIKFVRATGLVSGTLSLWTQNEAGTAQKEISGLKHYGVMILSRDEESPIDDDVLTAGFFTQAATLTYYNEKNQKKTRKYTASNPFNILAVDQGEPDWYAADGGTRPEEE